LSGNSPLDQSWRPTAIATAQYRSAVKVLSACPSAALAKPAAPWRVSPVGFVRVPVVLGAVRGAGVWWHPGPTEVSPPRSTLQRGPGLFGASALYHRVNRTSFRRQTAGLRAGRPFDDSCSSPQYTPFRAAGAHGTGNGVLIVDLEPVPPRASCASYAGSTAQWLYRGSYTWRSAGWQWQACN